MADLTRAYQFPNTRWTMVARSVEDDAERRLTALDELCRLYWPPVYAFVRSKGNTPHDAEDLVQGFFAKLLSRDDLAHLDQSKGKLRSFLLASVKNYMANEWEKATRQKRGGGIAVLSLDQSEAEDHCFVIPEPKESTTPDVIFQRQWIMTTLKHVLGELGVRYEKDGKEALFESLKPTLTPGAPMAPYAEIAETLGMSVSAVKMAVRRLKQRYAQLLCETVADTLGPEEDPEEEIAALMGSFD